MAKLRKTVIARIYRLLEGEHFSAADFKVDFPEEDRKYLEITFLHDATYSFQIVEISKRQSIHDFTKPASYVPASIQTPGNFKAREVIEEKSLEDCLEDIPNWCDNLNDELVAKVPQPDGLDELREKLEKEIKQNITEPDKAFTDEEIAELTVKFDELKEEFLLLSEKQNLTEAELESVKMDFESIKSNASRHTKGVWAGLTKNKIISIIKKVGTSKEARKLAYEGAKKALGF